jgi:hypothetical protein
MNTFPLYETLLRDTVNKDLTNKQKDLLLERIQGLDPSGKELTYALIKAYFERCEKKDGVGYLFDCEIKTLEGLSDITWDLTKLPPRLRQILFKFTEMNQQRQTELKLLVDEQIKMKNNQDASI